MNRLSWLQMLFVVTSTVATTNGKKRPRRAGSYTEEPARSTRCLSAKDADGVGAPADDAFVRRGNEIWLLTSSVRPLQRGMQ
jgi:hypothetical protein